MYPDRDMFYVNGLDRKDAILVSSSGSGLAWTSLSSHHFALGCGREVGEVCAGEGHAWRVAWRGVAWRGVAWRGVSVAWRGVLSCRAAGRAAGLHAAFDQSVDAPVRKSTAPRQKASKVRGDLRLTARRIWQPERRGLDRSRETGPDRVDADHACGRNVRARSRCGAPRPSRCPRRHRDRGARDVRLGREVSRTRLDLESPNERSTGRWP
jgi:hypothetical protein